MQITRVAVVSAHPLFGEGIASLLRSQKDLQVVPIDLQAGDAWERLQCFRPDAIVLETPEEPSLGDRLLGLSPCLYICVRLGDNAAYVYRERQIIYARPEEIVEAIRRAAARPADGGGP